MLGYGALGQYALGQGPENAPVAFTPKVLGSDSNQILKIGLSVAVIATTIVGFVAPPSIQVAKAFTEFSKPQRINNVTAQSNWPNTPGRSALVNSLFSIFSQPVNSRGMIADEMPSALFDIEPPPSIHFAGFASFSDVWRSKVNRTALFDTSKLSPVIIPSKDTHDLVFMADERKRKKKRDLFDEEKRRKERLRSDLELAIYGPPVVYTLPDWMPPPLPIQTPEIGDLAQIMIQAQATRKAQQELEDEQDIERLLRDLL